MNVLITGIHGFVGTNLVASLDEEHRIYGLDIIMPKKEGIIKTYSWDDLDQIPDVDCIIHLAGKAHDTKKTTEEKDYFDINFGLTKTIFDLFLKSAAKKFIYFSSVKAVVDTIDGELTEEVIPNPQTAYGKSKLASENYILEPTIPKEKSIYILRPCMIHGPGNKGNLNLLYKFVSLRIPWPLGIFKNKRSFCSIDNLLFAIDHLIKDTTIPSGIFNIADDKPLSTNEIVSLICESRGIRPFFINFPEEIINLT